VSPGVGKSARSAKPRLVGDEAELFERYAERLIRVMHKAVDAPHHVIEEACSIAWLQLIRTQPERGAVLAWLRVVATHEVLRLLGRDRREASLDEPTTAGVDSGEEFKPALGRTAELESTLEAREALEQIGRLPERQRRIFGLHVAGLSYDEIGAETGDSWLTVARQISRARLSLRDMKKGGKT
jgi:RNA polymerase sigma factor (sigma-70 family)